jgi:hypothetical protein
MNNCWKVAVPLLAGLLVIGCGGGDHGNVFPDLKADIQIPNVTAGTNFSFDIGAVDAANGRFYFTDRNNKSVDVIDITTNKLVKQIFGGFAGCNTGAACIGANNDKSGPDGLNVISGTTFIYVGDVNSVKVIDTTTDSVVNTIPIGDSSGLRADEGCYDPDHKIFMINSPGENPPFATFIDTTTQKVIATLLFTDPGTGPLGPPSAGLEACVYDHATQSFLNNNDGTTANPHGEVDVIPATFVLPGNPAAPVILTLPAPTPANGFKVFPLGNCDPTGLDLGPGTDVAVSCRQGTKGVPLTVEILDRTNGNVLKTLNAGGGDEITYDAARNRYYVAASRWTANGLSSGPSCTADSPCEPVLQVIDAGTRALIKSVHTGNNAHSVGVDSAGGQVYLPFSSATSPGGCSSCSMGDPIGNGGVLVFQD